MILAVGALEVIGRPLLLGRSLAGIVLLVLVLILISFLVSTAGACPRPAAPPKGGAVPSTKSGEPR